ncbi:hypothetical protein [Actinomycetospora sp. CA-084318]|uniref:hypothetical protein n=1 Tax=Actinomycetospora sp. CA-084318 TaxID=3239892 RepID=UPI003D9655B6
MSDRTASSAVSNASTARGPSRSPVATDPRSATTAAADSGSATSPISRLHAIRLLGPGAIDFGERPDSGAGVGREGLGEGDEATSAVDVTGCGARWSVGVVELGASRRPRVPSHSSGVQCDVDTIAGLPWCRRLRAAMRELSAPWTAQTSGDTLRVQRPTGWASGRVESLDQLMTSFAE